MHPAPDASTAGTTLGTGTSCASPCTPLIAGLNEVEAARRCKRLGLRFQAWIIGGMFCEHLVQDGEEVRILPERVGRGWDRFRGADGQLGAWRVGLEE